MFSLLFPASWDSQLAHETPCNPGAPFLQTTTPTFIWALTSRPTPSACPAPSPRAAAARPAVQRRSEFSARTVSNSIWSLAKMNHNPGEEFLQAMADEMVKPERLKDAVAQNVANALWAFATLGARPGCLRCAARRQKAAAHGPELTD